MIEAKKWAVLELALTAKTRFSNPFWEAEVFADFCHKEIGKKQRVEAFYDGENEAGQPVWKLRWTPVLEGIWTCEIVSAPAVEWDENTRFTIRCGPADADAHGFLRAIAGQAWEFHFDDGSPFFLFGDTIYNLFAGHYCGVDAESILRRRSELGVNYIRARMQVSPFHPAVPNQWQTRHTWPWGGSAQMPDFTRFNLEYFRAADEVIALGASFGIGFELIMEAWLNEFPFNDRGAFLPEYEDLWLRYLVARYAAYPHVYIWCPANEYEYYPNGQPAYKKEADLWLKRIARRLRELDPYGRLIGAHQTVQDVPLWQRLDDCEAIDVYLVQTNWYAEYVIHKRDCSLCMWLERDLRKHGGPRRKAVVCSEFGYERAEGLFTSELHRPMDHHHTRRGEWRAGFSGHAVVHGFDSTWGAYLNVSLDPPGTAYLPIYAKFMQERVPFYRMRPAQSMMTWHSGSEEEGTAPLCLADERGDVIAVYFPARGECELKLEAGCAYRAMWFNPRTGEAGEWREVRGSGNVFRTEEPDPGPAEEPWGNDWVLLLEAKMD